MRFVIDDKRILACGMLGLCAVLAGCGSSAPARPEPAKQMVFVDVATMKPMVHDVSQSFPAAHPQTGKRTLRPAMYCSKCQIWYPVQDLERLNRQPGAGLCPKTKNPLTFDGPWPDGSRQTSGK